MLTYAGSMSPGGAASVPDAQRDPDLLFYVAGFPGPRELGVIAESDEGAPIGAAWLRLLEGPPVPAHVATESEPELAIATVPTQRGRGVGEAMLRALLEQADRAYPATVLSVREANPSRHLYERMGYAPAGEIVNRVGTRSWRMRRASLP